MSSSTAFLLSTVAAWRSRVDERMAALLPGSGEGVAGAMRDAALAPGKRLRPLFMLAAGRDLRCESAALLDAACAVEMVHAASLVLDDMPCMDDARTRRGRPAVHVRHGEDTAMLATVALLAQACATVAALPGLHDGVRARVVGVLCETVGERGLVRGQYRDLREGAGARSLEAIAEANEQKTGVLFACALEIAALVSGAPHAVAPLREAAADLGQAFQLRDDLDDGTCAGKDRHQDAGKSTMVALLGRAAVEQRLRDHLARAESRMRAALPRGDGLLALARYAFLPQTVAATSHVVRAGTADGARRTTTPVLSLS